MSGQNRLILSQATLKGGKKGKSTFDDYAKRVLDANNEVTGKEDLGKGKRK